MGQVLETGPAQAVFSGPHHPYTAALLSSAPSLKEVGTERIRLSGQLPSLANLPKGCVFQTRCPNRIAGLCDHTPPPWIDLPAGNSIACHLTAEQLPRSAIALPAQ